jgi:hypothetical protein
MCISRPINISQTPKKEGGDTPNVPKMERIDADQQPLYLTATK